MRMRAAGDEELVVLQDIERAAGRCFRDIGMPEIADDEPPTLDELAAYRRAGRAWVAVDASDRPVAYLIADLVERERPCRAGVGAPGQCASRRGEVTARPCGRPGGGRRRTRDDPDDVRPGAVECAVLRAGAGSGVSMTPS